MPVTLSPLEIVLADAVFDGRVDIRPHGCDTISVQPGQRLVLKVRYRIVDEADHEHWSLRFRARVDGVAPSPHVLGREDKPGLADHEQDYLVQAFTFDEPGEHRVEWTMQAAYHAEPWQGGGGHDDVDGHRGKVLLTVA